MDLNPDLPKIPGLPTVTRSQADGLPARTVWVDAKGIIHRVVDPQE